MLDGKWLYREVWDGQKMKMMLKVMEVGFI
jgi:hypothetical protein